MSNSHTPTSYDVCYHFIATPLNTLLAKQQAINSEDKVLALFHCCASEVSAYRKFLKARGINPAEINISLVFQDLQSRRKADY